MLNENQPARREVIPIPSEVPIIKLPLQGIVDLDIESVELTPATPEAEVESFFGTNRDTFESVDNAWGMVKTGQSALKDTLNTFFAENQGGSRASRDRRRSGSRQLQAFSSPNKIYGKAKYDGFMLFTHTLQEIRDGRELEEYNNDFVAALEKHYVEAVGVYHEAEDKYAEELSSTHLKLYMSIIERQEVLATANAYARYRQEVALYKVAQLLQNDSVVPVFMQHILNLARTNEQDRDYPGILELLATHVKQKDRANMLQEAVFRTAPDPRSYAHEFITTINNGHQLPKELSAAVGMLELSADIAEKKFSVERSAFLAIMAGRADDWPPELKTRLEAYAATKTAAVWDEMQQTLSPFVREGRLPVEVMQSTIDLKYVKRKDLAAPLANKASTLKTSVIVGHANMEDLIGNTEKEPLSSFVILEPAGDKAGKKFNIYPVDSIEEIIELSNIRDYITEHREDKSLEQVIKAALEHLTREPKDPAHTKQYKGVTYLPEGMEAERKPRRFSPQHFVVPKVAKGPIVPKTRIIYDVFTYEGKPTLAIYGAWIKADIEQINNILPRNK